MSNKVDRHLEDIVSLSEGAAQAFGTAEDLKAKSFLQRLCTAVDSVKALIRPEHCLRAAECFNYASHQLLQSQSDKHGAWTLGIACLTLATECALESEGVIQDAICSVAASLAVAARSSDAETGKRTDASLWTMLRPFIFEHAVPMLSSSLKTAPASQIAEAIPIAAQALQAAADFIYDGAVASISTSEACSDCILQLAAAIDAIAHCPGAHVTQSIPLKMSEHFASLEVPKACLHSCRCALDALLTWLCNSATDDAFDQQLVQKAARAVSTKLAEVLLQLNDSERAMSLLELLGHDSSNARDGAARLGAELTIQALQCAVRTQATSAYVACLTAQSLHAGVAVSTVIETLVHDCHANGRSQQVCFGCTCRDSCEYAPKMQETRACL